MFGLGTQELIIILIIVLVLFGATQVPRLMRGIGQGIREFKSAVKDEAEKNESEADEQAGAAKK